MVKEWKKKEVEYLKSLMKNNKVIAIVDIFKLPALPFQRMRKSLRDKAVIRVAKKTLIKRALEEMKNEKPGIEKLEEKLGIEPAILVTNDNPFRLYKLLEKNKSPAPAVPGAIAPKDIVVPAGMTDFPPMQIPMFKKVGIKTKVNQGKIEILEDTVVTKAGEIIKPEVAELLNKLGIEPLEIGLDLVAAYEEGIIYTKDILAVDEEQYKEDLINSYLKALGFALEIAYPTKETLEHLLPKAFREAKAIAIETGYVSKDTIEDLIIDAVIKANALDITLNPDKAPKVEQTQETPKEEPKQEEKKQEVDAAAGLAALFG